MNGRSPSGHRFAGKAVGFLLVLGALFGGVSCRSTQSAGPDPFVEARRILDSVGIRTDTIHWDTTDSSVVIELDTAQSHLDSFRRWHPLRESRIGDHPQLVRPLDHSPFRRVVEILGAPRVYIVAVKPAFVREFPDGRREPGPLGRTYWMQISFDRAKHRIIKAIYLSAWEIDELLDPSDWTEIDRKTAGLRKNGMAGPELAALDTALVRWIGQADHGTWKDLPQGARLSGTTLILDTTFPRPWCKGLRVGDSLEKVVRVLGKPGFDQLGVPFYNASGFLLGMPGNGQLILGIGPDSVPAPQDLLPRVVLALRKREPIDTIPFWNRRDTMPNGSILYEGLRGLRVDLNPQADSAVVYVHSDFAGRLVDPVPPRHRVWIQYVNLDLVATRMTLDLAMLKGKDVLNTVWGTTPSGDFRLEYNGLPGAYQGFVVKDLRGGRPDCHILGRLLTLELVGDHGYRERNGDKVVEGEIEELWSRCR
jgi:hypothetical protein